MNSNTVSHAVLLALTLGISTSAMAQNMRQTERAWSEAITRVTAMPSDGDLQRRASEYGLNFVNVLWEDTGRSQGSAFGPNISDVTLQVISDDPNLSSWQSLLPVLRYPNFTDTTGDIAMDGFRVRVGNQDDGGEIRTVPLRDVLANLNEYLSVPVASDGPLNLLAERDTHVLVSAQHVFLPIPREGEAEFVPTIFNYQSAPGNPAVLTLVVTREGMSTSVVENLPNDSVGGYGQSLFYNAAGERATFTAERRSDVQNRIEAGNAQASDAGALEPGADVLLFIQIPLVHESRGYLQGLGGISADAPEAAGAVPSAPMAQEERSPRSDVEVAVLGHGEADGPFHELNGHVIRRDERFPIRVTVQFYRATSNGIVSDQELADAHAQIARVYEEADYVGSLVVPDGERNRPTDWIRTNPGGDTWLHGANVWWSTSTRIVQWP